MVTVPGASRVIRGRGEVKMGGAGGSQPVAPALVDVFWTSVEGGDSQNWTSGPLADLARGRLGV
jgi:hypothetical protein